MPRHLFIIALVGLAAIPAGAEEDVVWLTDQAPPTLISPVGPDSESASGVFQPDLLPDAPTEQAVDAAFALDEATDSAAETNEVENNGKNERPFRPVCECGCDIPCLDDWCVCDVTCCGNYPCGGHPCECSHGNCYLSEEDGGWVCNDACCDVWGPPDYTANSAVRFGWWGVGTDGSKQKTGEFQELESSPFWDIDTISSDGVRTWDIALSGLDNEANDARVRYYGPKGSAKFDFQRYFRRLDHDPIMGLDLAPGEVPPATPDGNVIADDLNVGEDYAIRVQELDAKVQRRLTDNVKWRMNVWSQRKFGERQSNATAHCFNVTAPTFPVPPTGNVCHVLSERQTIDWTTVEVQPVIEAKFEEVTVEYSRTMRSFGQDDEVLDRQYTRFGFQGGTPLTNGVLGPDYVYAMVPENFTQIDRLKVGANLTETNQLYANIFHGDTKNDFREMHREYSGYDLRLINTSIDDVMLTGYASRYDEETDAPPFFLDAPPLVPLPVPPSPSYDQSSVRHPVDYNRTRAGIKGSWQPFGDRGSRCSNYGLWDGTSLAGGYEYYQLERAFATYNTTPVPPGPFSQPDTITHQIEFGPSTRWSSTLDTYTRYKVQFIDVPLIGVSEYNDEPLEPPVQGAFNSSQPEQVHAVEIGGTWMPADNFMATTQFTIENSWHDSQYANFTENDYPIVCTIWYAPTQRLSLTSGYAYFSNWIDQDITLGTNRVVVPPATETTRWNYAGENHLVNFNASYAWTECVQLVGGYEWNRGTNAFDLPPSPAGADWSLLPFLSDVIVETQRVTTGVDWQPYRDTNLYLRYIFYDYEDLSSGLYSGTAHMGLAGVTRTW